MPDIDFLLDLALQPEKDEEVRAALYLCGSSGDYEHDGILTAFFDTPEQRDAAAESLRLLGAESTPREAKKQNWLDQYQQTLAALVVGERFIVTPEPGLVSAPEDRIVLHIPQERAFGTGSHESTALCLQMLEQIDLRGRVGMDVGTGSGILALAMLKLGARRAIAFDNDPEISGVIHRNAARNHIERTRLLAFVGSTEALRHPVCDILTMNILPEVIIPLLPEVAQWVSLGGMLIVSGILTMKREEVLEAAGKQSLRLAGESTQGEWWCGVLTR